MDADNNAAAAGGGGGGIPRRHSETILQNEDLHKRWEAAFKRVLTTVAVAVIARRVVFKSLV